MNHPNDFLSKGSINDRFILAIHALLIKKIAPDKATIADALNVKPAKFSEILNGRMKAGADMLAILCNYYDISPDWLLMCRGSLFRTSEYPPIIVIDDINQEVHYDVSSKPAATPESVQNGGASELLMRLLKEKDGEIGNLREEIGRLKARIEELKRVESPRSSTQYAHSTKPETVET